MGWEDSVEISKVTLICNKRHIVCNSSLLLLTFALAIFRIFKRNHIVKNSKTLNAIFDVNPFWKQPILIWYFSPIFLFQCLPTCV